MKYTRPWNLSTGLLLPCEVSKLLSDSFGKSLLLGEIIRSISTSIIYNKPTRCNSDSIVFIKNYKYALHVSNALCVHLQEHYKL